MIIIRIPSGKKFKIAAFVNIMATNDATLAPRDH